MYVTPGAHAMQPFHHLGSISVIISVPLKWVEAASCGFSVFLYLITWDDVSFKEPPLFPVLCHLYIPGSVNAFSLRWTSLESIFNTCFMLGLCWAADWVQNRATTRNWYTSLSSYSLSSESTRSRSLFSSFSFHACMHEWWWIRRNEYISAIFLWSTIIKKVTSID